MTDEIALALTWLLAIFLVMAFLIDYLESKREEFTTDVHIFIVPKKREVSAETRKKISVKALEREQRKRDAKAK